MPSDKSVRPYFGPFDPFLSVEFRIALILINRDDQWPQSGGS